MHCILACEQGRSEVVKIFTRYFGLDKTDAQSENNYALRLACEQGQIEVVKYLHDIFGLDKTDAQSENNRALCRACNRAILKLLNICTMYLD